MAARCSFDGYLSEALRDRIICGLRNEATQRHLLTKGDVDLAHTIELAQGMEDAQKDARALKTGSPDLAVGQVSRGPRAPRSRPVPKRTDSESKPRVCYRCGNPSHFARNCPHREATCHKCSKKGHLARACRGGGKSKLQANCITSDKGNPASDLDPIQTVHQVGTCSSNPRPYKVTLDIDGVPVEMEIDTWAAVSIISEATQKRLFPKARLSKSSVALRTYSFEPLTVLGQMKVKVSYQGYKGIHILPSSAG